MREALPRPLVMFNKQKEIDRYPLRIKKRKNILSFSKKIYKIKNSELNDSMHFPLLFYCLISHVRSSFSQS